MKRQLTIDNLEEEALKEVVIKKSKDDYLTVGNNGDLISTNNECSFFTLSTISQSNNELNDFISSTTESNDSNEIFEILCQLENYEDDSLFMEMTENINFLSINVAEVSNNRHNSSDETGTNEVNISGIILIDHSLNINQGSNI